MEWIELTVFTTDEGTDAVCARLDMLGLPEVIVRQGRQAVAEYLKNDVKYWDFADVDELAAAEPCVQVYIQADEKSDALIQRVRDSFSELSAMDIGVPLGSLRVTALRVADQDWANNWKAYYKPLPIGERLLVCPSWEKAENPDGRTLLLLDPGMAFGSGSHQTTRMCLEFLEANVKSGCELLDLGCGSGILYIAGLLLGAGRAVAVDIDEVALNVTSENAGLNGINEDRYEVLIGDILEDKAVQRRVTAQKYDVVTANIVAGVIVQLAAIVPTLLAEGGVFITSGIILERLEQVKLALQKAGLEIREEKIQGEWAAIAAVRA